MPCAPMAQTHITGAAGVNSRYPNPFSPSGLSLTLASGQDKNKESISHRSQSYESSDNMDDSEDDVAELSHPRKKRYHRHTPQQIQEMEALFKEFPHPDEKQGNNLAENWVLLLDKLNSGSRIVEHS